MILTGYCAKLPCQFRVINGQHLSRGRLDIDSEFGNIGGHGIEPRRDRLCLGLVRRLRSLLRVAKSRTVQQHLLAFAAREIREASRRSRTPECENSITIDAGKPGEHL